MVSEDSKKEENEETNTIHFALDLTLKKSEKNTPKKTTHPQNKKHQQNGRFDLPSRRFYLFASHREIFYF